MTLAFCGSIPAGFPSPARDEMAEVLDVRDFLIRHPLSTFFFTLKQDYRRFELRVRDVLVVDRAACLSNGALVLGVRDGEFTLCLGRESEGTEIWGVVVAMMRRMQ